MTVTRIFDEKIKRAFADFERHERTLTVIFALRCKAVLAVKITGVGNVKTKCLNDGRPFCKLVDIGTELVFGKQFALPFKFFQIVNAFFYFFKTYGVFCRDFFEIAVVTRFFVIVNEFERNFVNDMHRAAGAINGYVISTFSKSMYHNRQRPPESYPERSQVESKTDYFAAFSHFWFATPQEVLHADWQEVWHSPQPPFCLLFSRLRVFRVTILFIVTLLNVCY